MTALRPIRSARPVSGRAAGRGTPAPMSRRACRMMTYTVAMPTSFDASSVASHTGVLPSSSVVMRTIGQAARAIGQARHEIAL